MKNIHDSRVILAAENLLTLLSQSENWDQWKDLISILGEDCETANTAARLMISREKDAYLSLRRAIIEHEAYYRGRSVEHGYVPS